MPHSVTVSHAKRVGSDVAASEIGTRYSETNGFVGPPGEIQHGREHDDVDGEV